MAPVTVPAWTRLPALHQPPWPDRGHLDRVLDQLRTMPPLVVEPEVAALRSELAEACAGRAFLLQVGDCAESFAELTAPALDAKAAVYGGLAGGLAAGLGVRTVLIGRIAGQYAKPRTSPVERRGSTELLSFRGENVNGPAFAAADRRPDPDRLLQGYLRAATAVNYLRALAPARSTAPALRYTSHEALLLPYEDALVRAGAGGERYAGSAHTLWVGERTRQLGGAHLEFLARLASPVGCKCGPDLTPAAAVATCQALNPDRLPGRLTLITRMGADRIGRLLPPIVRAVRDAGHPVLWSCDPMHGNPYVCSADGYRAREFDWVLAEVHGYLAVHADAGTWPGGLHLECAAEPVTECVGGPGGPRLAGLRANHRTLCDPRLNPAQAQELVRRTVEWLAPAARPGRRPPVLQAVR